MLLSIISIQQFYFAHVILCLSFFIKINEIHFNLSLLQKVKSEAPEKLGVSESHSFKLKSSLRVGVDPWKFGNPQLSTIFPLKGKGHFGRCWNFKRSTP